MKMIRYLCIINFICIFSVLFSCRGVQKTDASTTTPTATPATDPKNQVGDNAMGFRVWAKSDPIASYISHKGTGSILDDFNSKCEVNSTDSVKDIECIIEGEELDLFYQGLTLNYNAPASMCSYVQVQMPFYFNKKPGKGPTAVTDNSNGTAVNGGVAAGATNETCNFKYKDVNGNDKENCCIGDYTLTTWSRTASGVGFDSSVVTTKKWGGSIASCLSGPAIAVMPKDKNGFPKSEMYYVEGTGILSSYKIPSPMGLGLYSNIFIANYFNPADHVGGLPTALTPVSDFPTFSPTPKYVFNCLDRAYDPIARITLSVRDWNERSQLVLGAVGSSDTTGTTSFGTPINNRDDLKDTTDATKYSTGYPSE